MSQKLKQINQATLTLINQKGLQSVSVAQIAKEANISVGTIYNYYASKEELVNQLYKDIAQRLVDHCLSSLPQNTSPKEQFFSLNTAFMDYFLSHQLEFDFVDNHLYSPYISDEAKDNVSPFIDKLRELHTTFTETKEIKAIPCDLFLKFSLGSLHSIMRGYHAGLVSMDKESLKKTSLSLCWNGLKK